MEDYIDIALVVYVMFTLCTRPFRGASIFSYAIFVVVIKSLHLELYFCVSFNVA